MRAPAQQIGSLEAALLNRLGRPVDIGPRKHAAVALDIAGDEGWTLHSSGDDLKLARGLAPDATTTISTDEATMVQVLEGARSGIEAFISGDLRVRGDLALSLRLSGTVVDGAPARFPKAAETISGRVHTFYLEAGAGSPIVLLHGLGATNASMLPSIWDLGQDHHVFAPDLPGFGDSSKPLRSYDAAFFGEWFEGLLDALGIERAHVVGNSLGGRVAIEAALRVPQRVDRLVLLAPSPAFIRRREFVRLVQVLRPEMAFLPLPLPHKRVVGSIKAMFSRPDRLPDQWYEAAADEFLRVFSTPRGRIAFFSAARQIYLEEPYGEKGFWDRLTELQNPSLFVWGERDRLVPARFARHVMKAVPHAESVVLEDCGHAPQFELPDRTHDLIRRFIST